MTVDGLRGEVPAPLLRKDELLDVLLATFRAEGYDGASLARLSEVTGLGRSSLYHHFPGGKEEMARAVLDHLADRLEASLLGPLRSDGPPAGRLEASLAALDAFYEGGRAACLLERLCASVDAARFRARVGELFGAWRGALAQVGRDAGLGGAEADERAEDAIVRVEGALVLAAGTGDPSAFGRALERVRRSFLAT